MFLNSSCPLIYCKMRRTYMFDCGDVTADKVTGATEFEDCVIYGINSIRGRALGFTCLTRRGASFTRMPITAFVHDDKAPDMPLGALELWDCFSYHFSVVQFQYLKGKQVKCKLRGHKPWEFGKYIFTVDWCAGDEPSDLGDSEDSEHKSGHLIELDNGCYALLPNNRCIWMDASYVDTPLDIPKEGHPGYMTHSHRYSVEGNWHVAPTEDYFYEVKE